VTLYLLHHGDALDPAADPQRPLSPLGVQQARRVSQAAAARGAKPEAVWHSGKLRARQTAEIFWKACNPLAEFLAVPGLQPADPPERIADRLATEERDLALAGHMPHLPRLVSLLLRDEAFLSTFPAHGVVALSREAGTWRHLWTER
jgi:phosphohistidine phosphatase